MQMHGHELHLPLHLDAYLHCVYPEKGRHLCHAHGGADCCSAAEQPSRLSRLPGAGSELADFTGFFTLSKNPISIA